MNRLTKFKSIKSFIFDVDGVFTNSNLLVTESGEMLRTMNIRDGYAVKKAIQEGLQIIIITGGNSHGVVKRLEGLGVKKIYFGISDKPAILESLVKNNIIDLSTTAFMGDDIPDLDCMKQVFLPCCPKDADPEIIEISDYVSPINGGRGAVRDVLGKLLKIQEKWG